MRVGAVFPQLELAGDVAMIRDWAQAVESLGYADVLVTEHVVGFRDEPAQSVYGPVVPQTPMQEPLVLFGYLAAVTRRIGLSTGVLVLPQRQTTLVAKQAAAADMLSGGRLRLGVGAGYVPSEFRALNSDYHNRGARIVEQIEVLRALWTEQVVSYHGHWHEIDAAGINPMPVQQPIPIWMGGMSDPAMRRAAKVSDGWMSILTTPDDKARAVIERLRAYVAEAGRATDDIGINVFLFARGVPVDNWIEYADGWRELGVTDVSVDFTGCGYTTADQHIAALQRSAEHLGLRPS
jgi:probable F420-dependent oxidoreductase